MLLRYFTNISMLCLFWQLLPDVDSVKSFQLFKSCIAALSRRCICARVLWHEELQFHLGDLACAPGVPGWDGDAGKGSEQGLDLCCHLTRTVKPLLIPGCHPTVLLGFFWGEGTGDKGAEWAAAPTSESGRWWGLKQPGKVTRGFKCVF